MLVLAQIEQAAFRVVAHPGLPGHHGIANLILDIVKGQPEVEGIGVAVVVGDAHLVQDIGIQPGEVAKVGDVGAAVAGGQRQAAGLAGSYVISISSRALRAMSPLSPVSISL